MNKNVINVFIETISFLVFRTNKKYNVFPRVALNPRLTTFDSINYKALTR